MLYMNFYFECSTAFSLNFYNRSYLLHYQYKQQILLPPKYSRHPQVTTTNSPSRQSAYSTLKCLHLTIRKCLHYGKDYTECYWGLLGKKFPPQFYKSVK